MATTKKSTTKKTEAEPKDEPVEEEAAEPVVAAAETPDGPRPWRVEPYSDGEKWGYRVCAANGQIITESDLRSFSAREAVDKGAKDDLARGARIPRRV